MEVLRAVVTTVVAMVVERGAVERAEGVMEGGRQAVATEVGTEEAKGGAAVASEVVVKVASTAEGTEAEMEGSMADSTATEAGSSVVVHTVVPVASVVVAGMVAQVAATAAAAESVGVVAAGHSTAGDRPTCIQADHAGWW